MMIKFLSTLCHYIAEGLVYLEAGMLILTAVLLPVSIFFLVGTMLFGLSYAECGIICAITAVLFGLAGIISLGSDYYDKHFKKGEKD